MGIGDVRVVLYLPIFLGGILISRKGLLNRFKNKYLIFYILILLLVIYYYAVYLYPNYFQTTNKPSLISTINIITFVILNMMMFLFVIIVKHLSLILKNWKYYTIIKSVSYASYSIFLFHRPIWWLFLKIYNPMNGYVRGGFLVIIGIPVTIVTSYYMQKAYDYYIAGRFKIK
jgi:peptidoglycan/LPS O-acetylase OafA/YrhL